VARRVIVAVVCTSTFVLSAAPALACGGLVAEQGGINLVRTSTMAAYHGGVEHYVTSFEFAGAGGGEFGSIVPLPGIPSNVRKGGDWTLERLTLETQPPVETAEAFGAALSANESTARVIERKRIEALDVVVLEGGGDAVGRWAEEHGFFLPPDAPEVLDFYAERSPIFMAVKYDVAEAKQRGLQSGDGTPVHVSIPTPNPWVPLRILGLGKDASERIEADVYLLTDERPNMLPAPSKGMTLEVSEGASSDLLADLRSDRGMKWLPRSDMWLSYLRIDTTAGALTHDLAIDASGTGSPSPVAAGLERPFHAESDGYALWPWLVAAAFAVGVVSLTGRTLPARP
jgi:hypothetical protein